MPDARKFDNPVWSYDGQPGQPVDPRRFTRMVDGNQPDLVPDEKPSPNMETRILRDAARQRISEIIGPYFMDATAMVDGDLVRNQDERPIRFKIWAPHRKIAIERLPKGVATIRPSCVVPNDSRSWGSRTSFSCTVKRVRRRRCARSSLHRSWANDRP
jgi:hypothetical protein